MADMYVHEFDKFRVTMDSLCDVFTRPHMTDNQLAVYWDALKDQHIDSFRRAAAHCTKFSKFMPKPVELRPRGEKPPEPQDDRALDNAEKLTVQAWEELRARNPGEYWVKFREAYVARLGFRFDPASQQYEQEFSRCNERVERELYNLAQNAL
jgi:hypothetical protein